jgi:methionine-rich copper-binding protein CopC
MPARPRLARRAAVPGVVRLLAAGLMTAALLLGPGVTAAFAHDALVAITPTGNSTLDTVPAQVTLEFSEPPQALGTRVLVSGPDGGQVSEGAVELRGTSVIQPLSGDLPAGNYTVQWRATSSDGHSLAGTSTFVIGPGTSAATGPPDIDPATPARKSADVVPAAPDEGGPSSPVAWTAGGAVLAAAGVLGLRKWRRRP